MSLPAIAGSELDFAFARFALPRLVRYQIIINNDNPKAMETTGSVETIKQPCRIPPFKFFEEYYHLARCLRLSTGGNTHPSLRGCLAVSTQPISDFFLHFGHLTP